MDDPRILRIITVGLILAALAVVYFLFTGGFSVGKPKVSQNQTAKVSPSPTPVITASPNPSATPAVVNQALPTAVPTATAEPVSTTGSGGAIASTGAGNSLGALPRTGFPIVLAIVFSFSAVAVGLGLRKFPH